MKYIVFISCLVALVLLSPEAALASTVLVQEVSVGSTRVALAKSRPFTLVYGTRKFTASAGEVSKWFKSRSADDAYLLQLRPSAIYNYLNVFVSPKVNQLGTQSRFKYIDGNLHLIGPGAKGKIVDGIKTSLAIRSALVRGSSSATIYMKEHRPSVFSATDFNKLSFPDKLARGESSFAGSPNNRIHNIQVATKRFDGLVIMPNEEFSFNNYLGSVNATNGYLPELVIKDNVTTPEYGGGICQVSTTAFRAAMESGMNITYRRNHSYPVAYYGAPGYDATVYQPAPDMKFVNDTGSPVYLETKIIGKRVVFDVWGKKNNREVRINGPFVTSRRPDGSITAAVAQFVKQNGKTIREKNFVSNYQSADKFPEVVAGNKG
jgi:vancomycin resistance protein YoaR